jgi:hypothetical protein
MPIYGNEFVQGSNTVCVRRKTPDLAEGKKVYITPMKSRILIVLLALLLLLVHVSLGIHTGYQ